MTGRAQVQGWRLDENQNVEMAGDETAAGFSNKAYSSKDQSKGQCTVATPLFFYALKPWP
jgi:hypothetical protein